MSFSWVRCPEAGNVLLEFQDEANPYWTSLWVRNASLPLTKVEVKSANHAEFTELSRGTDGTFTDASGFGEGAFTLRVTASDDSMLTIEQTGFEPGSLVDSGAQFP